VNPFNPCLPWPESDACDRHPPVDPEWPPFKTTIKTKWPVYRAWSTMPVWYDEVHPATPEHLIEMPSTRP
jgi:hypothetical protein